MHLIIHLNADEAMILASSDHKHVAVLFGLGVLAVIVAAFWPLIVVYRLCTRVISLLHGGAPVVHRFGSGSCDRWLRTRTGQASCTA